jgi:hypothetical protein
MLSDHKEEVFKFITDRTEQTDDEATEDEKEDQVVEGGQMTE